MLELCEVVQQWLLARVAKVRECAMDSLARVAKVRECAMDSLARVAKLAVYPDGFPGPRQVSVDHSPRSTVPGVTDATRGDV